MLAGHFQAMSSGSASRAGELVCRKTQESEAEKETSVPPGREEREDQEQI